MVSEISFIPRIDWTDRVQASWQAPKEFEIWATNKPIPTAMDQIMNPTMWQKLAQVSDVRYDRESNYQAGTLIDMGQRGPYFTYGIYMKRVDSVYDHVAISRVTFFQSYECHP